MKLAQIGHKRCGEWRASTYVWVNDDFSQIQLNALAAEAQRSYFDAEDAWKNSPTAPPKPHWLPEYDKFPGKTVAEVKAEHQAQLDTYNAWDNLRVEAKRDFIWHLELVGKGNVVKFYDPDKAHILTTVINWGHRHGEQVDYSETEINHNFGDVLQDKKPEATDGEGDW